MTQLKKISSTTKLCFGSVKRKALQWSAKRPILVFTMIVCASVILLPAVTIAALTPVALIFTYSSVLAQKGGLNILYAILFQGFLIATIIVALFVIAFTLGVFLSVLHSYRSFFTRLIPTNKRKQL